MPRTLAIATGNPHKLIEIRALLAPFHVDVVSARDLGLGEVEETGHTFAANALLKAAAAFVHSGLPSLADDSGLVVDALGGAPGVYSARYAGPGADDAANNRKLIAALADVPAERRTARFVSSVAVVLPSSLRDRVGVGAWSVVATPDVDGAIGLVVEGTVEGVIVDAPRGQGGFGYDPHFLYVPAGRTFAELAPAEKHAISHRGNAMRALSELFSQLYQTG